MENRELSRMDKALLYVAKNLIQTDDGYKLVPYAVLDNAGNIIKNPTLAKKQNDGEKDCRYCMHHMGFERPCCKLVSEISCCEPHHYIPSSIIMDCDAYDPVEALHIIQSEQDMIDFIEKTHTVFDSQEHYEEYFGFSLSYEEDTGNTTETVRQYYNRGGKFDNIPKEYPCVIYFDPFNFGFGYYNHLEHWIKI